jgi:hypothetical protein
MGSVWREDKQQNLVLMTVIDESLCHVVAVAVDNE